MSVAAGDSTTCVITTAGAVKCWGKNAKGQLGNGQSGTQVESHVPVDTTGLTAGATSITTGYDFSCAVIAGAAKCWGDNFDDTIGNGQGPGYQTAQPVAVTGLGTGVTSIAASAHHVCAIAAAGAVKCWGAGGGGELGVGTLDDSTFKGAYVAAGGFDRPSAEQVLTRKSADLVAFGRPFIANPDLVSRLQHGFELAPPDTSKAYTPGPSGHTDYPSHGA